MKQQPGNRPRILLYLGLAVLIGLFPFVAPNEFYLRLAQDIAIWSIAAIGLNLLLGYSGQLSLGQSAFFALGAYGSGILATTPVESLPGTTGLGGAIFWMRGMFQVLA